MVNLNILRIPQPMNKSLSLALAGAALYGVLGAALADEPTSETRSIDARVVRVKVDGAVDLHVRQGAPATLVLSGDPRYLTRTVTEQHGDTLQIDSNVHGHMRMGSLHAELTLPALRELSSESLGSTSVSGFSGEELKLTLDGAGSMQVAANYRMVTVDLGGIGSMQLRDLNAEGVKLNLQGAGFVSLSGRAHWLKADLGGLGSLDARQFVVDTVNVDLSGLGNASVNAHQNATLNLSGLGSVTVYGKPLNRKVAVDGLGKVSWK
jgi:hypothetical protein